MDENSGLTIRSLTGDDARGHLDAIAALRIAVFRDWPYLYAGDMDYERDYLSAYVRSPRSVFVLATDGDRVVGASTGIPLLDDAEAFRAPFATSDMDAAEVFYFGESVLLPEYRGRGLGHAFFDHREAHARSFGEYRWTAFAAVDRKADDPRKPAGHRGNEAFWAKRGYERQPDMTMRLHWDEVGIGETGHALTFWLRELEAAR